MNSIRLLTRGEAAEVLGVSPYHLCDLIRSGQLKDIKAGRRSFVSPRAIEQFLEQAAANTAPASPK